MSKPLTKLMSEQEKAFKKINDVFCDKNVLLMPDLNKLFVILTDASHVGLGAQVWCNKKQDMVVKPRPVAFAKCLAVVWAIDRFRPHLEYTTFILESDAQALKLLMLTPEPSSRFGCWAEKIQCGAFNILYRQGSQNKVVDALLRAPLPVTEIPITDHVKETEITQFWPDWSENRPNPIGKISEKSEYSCNQEEESEVEEPETLHIALTEILNDIPPTKCEIIETQRSDPVWKKIQNYLNESEEVRQEMNKPIFEEELNDCGNGFKAVIPQSLVKTILFTCHEHPLSSHADRSKTFDRSKHLYYWPRMDPDNYPLTTATSSEIVNKENEVACRFGHPSKIISDNSPQFVSTIYKEFCAKRYITVGSTSTYHSQANPTERTNRDIKMMLAIYTDVHSQWPRYLNEFAYAQLTNKSEATCYFPLHLNTSRMVPLYFNPRSDRWTLSGRRHILSDADKAITLGFSLKRDSPWEIVEAHGREAYNCDVNN
uniref:RNA-directed DNA polymerase n=1 Tax=Strigamia maritima TaxID=126957 RepID=T1JKV6_STRMM